MSYPVWIYPEWANADDYDGPEDYSNACAIAEESYDLAQAAEHEIRRHDHD